MDKLQWFKFSYADWRMGKIQRCSEVTQSRFINLCCLYWSKEANLSYEDAEIEIDKEHLDVLLSKKIIEVDDNYLIIKFLDEQLDDITETSKGKSKAAKARWDKYRKDKAGAEQSDTDAMHVHTDALQNSAEKRREEKRREEENNIDLIYSLYPTKCPIRNANTGKGSKNKDQIKKLLKKHSVENLKGIIENYVNDCVGNGVYLKNFTTLLNNLPDEIVEPVKKATLKDLPNNSYLFQS